MKDSLRALCVAAAVATTAWAEDAPAKKTGDLTIAIVPAKDKSGALVIDRDGEFPVVFTNRSDKPIRIWTERCRLGYETLSFRAEDESGQSSRMYQPARHSSDWRDAPPQTVTIPAGGTFAWKVMPGSIWGERTWKGVPEPNTGKPVKLTAVLEIKPTDAAKKNAVWTGRITSAPVSTLVNDPKLRTPHDYLREDCPKQALAMMKADKTLLASTDDLQQLPLHLAARHGFRDVVEWMLSNGTDVNATAYNRFTPLHLAKDPEMVKLLVDHKANVNAKNVSGRTALEEAADLYARLERHPDAAAECEKVRRIMKILLDAGAHYDIRSACCVGDVEKVRALLKDKKQVRDKDAMRMAATYGHAAIVKLLIENGADPKDSGYGGLPVAYFAIEHPAALKSLFDAGADPGATVTYRGNGQGPEGSTLLHEAASKGAVESAKLLLARGIDVNTKDRLNSTPLHEACWHGQVAMVEFLLKSKADANARNKNGWTPMFAAAYEVRPEQEEDNAQHRAAMQALARGGAEMDLFAAIASNDVQRVATILKTSPKAGETKDPAGLPALHRAVRLDAREIVNLLLDKGCNPDIRSADTNSGHEGETPLLEAAFWGRFEAAEALIKHGANVNATAARKVTPLHEAARMGKLDVARLLLKHGADANAKDDEGKTPLDWGQLYHEAPEMTELLRSHASPAKKPK
jgi:ankyrin repeat protein